MPRGDKSKYTDKQKRMAEHIEQGYEERGLPEREAERRAWATVNAETHGGKKPGGSGRGKPMNNAPSRKGGRKGRPLAVARHARERGQEGRGDARAAGRAPANGVEASFGFHRDAQKNP
jgi:hypothetical protein